MCVRACVCVCVLVSLSVRLVASYVCVRKTYTRTFCSSFVCADRRGNSLLSTLIRTRSNLQEGNHSFNIYRTVQTTIWKAGRFSLYLPETNISCHLTATSTCSGFHASSSRTIFIFLPSWVKKCSGPWLSTTSQLWSNEEPFALITALHRFFCYSQSNVGHCMLIKPRVSFRLNSNLIITPPLHISSTYPKTMSLKKYRSCAMFSHNRCHSHQFFSSVIWSVRSPTTFFGDNNCNCTNWNFPSCTTLAIFFFKCTPDFFDIAMADGEIKFNRLVQFLQKRKIALTVPVRVINLSLNTPNEIIISNIFVLWYVSALRN